MFKNFEELYLTNLMIVYVLCIFQFPGSTFIEYTMMALVWPYTAALIVNKKIMGWTKKMEKKIYLYKS
jgi:hypothetical protein